MESGASGMIGLLANVHPLWRDLEKRTELVLVLNLIMEDIIAADQKLKTAFVKTLTVQVNQS